jgi:hypothetical protein
VYELLSERDIFKKDFLEKQIMPDIAYRLSLYWMLDMLEKAGIDIHVEKKKS